MELREDVGVQLSHTGGCCLNILSPSDLAAGGFRLLLEMSLCLHRVVSNGSRVLERILAHKLRRRTTVSFFPCSASILLALSLLRPGVRDPGTCCGKGFDQVLPGGKYLIVDGQDHGEDRTSIFNIDSFLLRYCNNNNSGDEVWKRRQ